MDELEFGRTGGSSATVVVVAGMLAEELGSEISGPTEAADEG